VLTVANAVKWGMLLSCDVDWQHTLYSLAVV